MGEALKIKNENKYINKKLKKTQKISSVDENVERLEALCTVGGNVK